MKEFFKKVGNQIKIVVGVLLGILGFIFFFFFRNNTEKLKDLLEDELEMVKSEIEIAKINEDLEDNKEKLESLQEREKKLREKIKAIEEGNDDPEYLTDEELDEFFDSRGF